MHIIVLLSRTIFLFSVAQRRGVHASSEIQPDESAPPRRYPGRVHVRRRREECVPNASPGLPEERDRGASERGRILDLRRVDKTVMCCTFVFFVDPPDVIYRLQKAAIR